MPFINIRTSVAVSDEKEKKLIGGINEIIGIFPGKSPQWLMTEINSSCNLCFGEKNNEPVAFVDVKIYGKQESDSYSEFTEKITQILNQELGINPSNLYVCYVETYHWGYNGSNF